MIFLEGKAQQQILQQLDEMCKRKFVIKDGKYFCSDCDFNTKPNTNIKSHIDSKHPDLAIQIHVPTVHSTFKPKTH